MFKIKSSIRLSDQDAILKKILKIPGVANAARLVPSVRGGDLANICYVQLEDTENSMDVQKSLKSLKELEDISVPTDRSLSGHK
ncbi:MAG: hypothetical protein AAFX07_13800 [Pseudomonadota bacterium]